MYQIQAYKWQQKMCW